MKQIDKTEESLIIVIGIATVILLLCMFFFLYYKSNPRLENNQSHSASTVQASEHIRVLLSENFGENIQEDTGTFVWTNFDTNQHKEIETKRYTISLESSESDALETIDAFVADISRDGWSSAGVDTLDNVTSWSFYKSTRMYLFIEYMEGDSISVYIKE